jgi:hypothetical protein
MRVGKTSDVVSALREAHKRRCSAVILSGAGCSVSAGVPTAWEITDYIRFRHPEAHAAASGHDYPSVMHKLAWQSRYALFHNLVRVAGLNWAHVGLAILMQRGWVGRLLTTNFDDLALRACALYGLHPSTHDLAVSAALDGGRAGDAPLQYRNSLLREPAVLYLHGRHNGFAQKHSNAQLHLQASLLRPVIEGAKQRERPWIVVGYSGDSDPLFDTVRSGGFPGGLYWVNLRPPTGAAARALKAPNACFIPSDADNFFLELLRGTVGGGRELLLPSLLHPAAALSLLPAPGKGVAPGVPSVKSLRSVLDQAFKSSRIAAKARREPSPHAAALALRAELVRIEGLWQQAGAAPTEAAFRRAAEQVQTALDRAIQAVGTRDEALAQWTTVLGADEPDVAAATAAWRRVVQRYRQACGLEPLVAWAMGRRATVVAQQAQRGWVPARQLHALRAGVEALDGCLQRPSMALAVGWGDLLFASARLQGARAAGPRAGSVLLRQAASAYRQAGLAAAECPPADRRFRAAQDLARAARRSGGAGRSLARVQLQRERIRALCGL